MENSLKNFRDRTCRSITSARYW